MEDLETKKKATESENKKMFRSRFDIFVLNALNDKDGASYGYDVINYIQSKTKGHYKIKTFSTIYNTLKRLEEQGYVVSGKGDGETNGAARVYYTLTPEGKAYLEESKEEYKYLRTLLDNLLTDEDFDLDNEEAPYNAGVLKPLTKRTRSDSEENKTEEADPSSSVSYDISDEQEAVAIIEELKSEEEAAATSYIQVYKREPEGSKEKTNESVLQAEPVKRKTKKTNPVTDYKTVIEKITAQTFVDKPKKNREIQPFFDDKKENNDVKQPIVSEEKIVSSPKPAQSEKEAPVQTREKDLTNLDKFRVGIRSEGYAFNSYKPKTAKSVKYVYVNKLLRDSVVLSSLYFFICILVLFLLRKTFEFSLTALLACGGIALSIALSSALIWFKNPDKRKKDVINLKLIHLACVGLFTVFFMIDLIVALLIPNGKGLASPSTYSPVIAATVSLFYGIIFSVLYKSDNYFAK